MKGVNNIIETKKEIRKYMLKQRDMIDKIDKQKWDNEIFNKVINSEYYKNAKMIFLFVSFKSEVDTHKLIEYVVKDNKEICVPKIETKEKGIELYKITGLNDLKVGYYNVLEPIEGSKKINSKKIDLILMPGVAFDKEGGRVGYGGGYYDRFLKESEENRVKRIAIAYDFQLLDKVPMDKNDIRIDGIITNKKTYIC